MIRGIGRGFTFLGLHGVHGVESGEGDGQHAVVRAEQGLEPGTGGWEMITAVPAAGSGNGVGGERI